MKTAFFTNYSSEPFTGYWDGKGRTFQPGETKLMPEYLAYHFAIGLANRELIKLGKERSTSPKFPEQVPDFMEQLNKAYKIDEDPEEPLGEDKDDIDALMRVAEHNRGKAKLPKGAQSLEHKKPQDLPEVDGEELPPATPAPKRSAPTPNAFEGKPNEAKLAA